MARIGYLDFVRVLACMMIILMHAPLPKIGAESIVLSSIYYLTAPAIGLFFMASGALLIPTQLSASGFIRKRLARILWPTISWTIIYVVLRYLVGGESVDSSLINSILSIPFSAQGHGVLWFMYTLLGFYLIIPIISPWISKALPCEVLGYASICLFTFCFPYLSRFLTINTSETSLFYYFMGYGGYFLFGYLMMRYGRRISGWFYMVIYLLMWFPPIICKLYIGHIDFRQNFWYLSLPIALSAISLFGTIQKLDDWWSTVPSWLRTFVEKVSKLSFGIYLMHIAVMRFFVWDLAFVRDINSYPLQILVIFTLTFIITLFLCWLISLTPLSPYLIGLKPKSLTELTEKRNKPLIFTNFH